MDSEVKAKIERAISSSDVILFMKGTPSAPACGFSARTVEVLDTLLDDYAAVDVLAHPEIRDGVKEYSSWPTIPQLYVKGQFIGGADIVTDLFESGHLREALGLAPETAQPPNITITTRAAEALRGFIGDSGEIVLLEIDRAYSPSLSIGPRPARGLIAESQGLEIALDQLSAGRAAGITIDYVETREGAAFKIDNPNEPPRVRQLSVTDLKTRLGGPDGLRLIDVRTPSEWQTARIAGAELLDADLMESLRDLPKDHPIALLCHHGHRSQRVAEQLVNEGFTRIYNVSGGIDAWSIEVDPNIPRY